MMQLPRTNTLTSGAAVTSPAPKSEETIVLLDEDTTAGYGRTAVITVRGVDVEDSDPTERTTVAAVAVAARFEPDEEEPDLAATTPAAATPKPGSTTLPSLPARRPPPAILALGSLLDVPYVKMDPLALRERVLSVDAMSVFELIDGHRTIEDILDASKLEANSVVEVLGALLSFDMVDLRQAARPPEKSRK